MDLVAPAIILDRPQLAQNIGAVARAMANFGLTDLRLVAPRDGRPQELALIHILRRRPTYAVPRRGSCMMCTYRY